MTTKQLLKLAVLSVKNHIDISPKDANEIAEELEEILLERVMQKELPNGHGGDGW